jgi:hypothetical protein
MSKLGTLMRDSISAEKQSVEQKQLVSSTVISSPKEPKQVLNTQAKTNASNVLGNIEFVRYYYAVYASILQSQFELFELIQKEQVAMIQNNISSGFAILNSFKTGIKSLKS